MSKIQWTDVTDNIFRVETGGWYCKKISPGCAGCYAEKINQNAFFGGNGQPYSGPAPKIILLEDIVSGWARQTKPKRHFVCSMTDLFGDWVTQDQASRFLTGMAAAPRQTFQLLSKRPEIMFDRCTTWLQQNGLDCLPKNILPMTSVENQDEADRRIPWLLRTPAAGYGLSVEPLLGPVDLEAYLPWKAEHEKKWLPSPLSDAIGRLTDVQGVSWIIVGGESGSKARPCNVIWIRSLVQQGRAAGVPVFMKQMGEWLANGMRRAGHPVKARKGENPSEWPADLRIREFPEGF